MGLNAILSGHINELFGLNTNIAEKRLNICKECPLFHKSMIGYVCNSKLWYNPDNGDISNEYKDGYINGCGCRLYAKTREVSQTCPAGKW